MRIISCIMALIILGVISNVVAQDSRSETQRKADEARQKFYDDARKAKEAKEKAQQDAEEAKIKAKQKAEYEAMRANRRKEYLQQRKSLFDEKPLEFFKKYIDKKLILYEGAILDVPETLSGRIIQIPSDSLLILDDHKTGRTIAVGGYTTAGLVDDQEVSFKVAKERETFRYVNVLGAVKTVEKCTPPKWLTYEDFDNLKKKINILDAVESYLLRNNIL